MPQRILILALVLLSLGLGIHAYRQSSARLGAENQLRVLETKLNQAAKAPPAHSAVVATLPSAPPVPPPIGTDTPSPNAEKLAQTNTPEMQRLMDLRTRSALDRQYAALFKYLALPPDKLQKLVQLLQDRQNIFHDVVTVMRSQGIAPIPENSDKIQALVNNAAAEIDSQIHSALGDDAYARYQDFELTQMQRQTADRVQQRLSYTAEPLTDSQYAQLVNVIAQVTPTKADAATRPSRGKAVDTALVTPVVIDLARAFLSPAQLAALQQIQAEQEASAQLARQTAGNGG